jgi:hypothetical protein
MKYKPINLGTLLLLFLTVVAAFAVNWRLSPVNAAPQRQTTALIPTEFWRLGLMSTGTGDYAASEGRLLQMLPHFRSDQPDADAYYLFSAPGRAKTVQTARFYLLQRTGAYTGAVTLTLETLAYDGTLRHTVSAGSINLQTATPDVWTALAPLAVESEALDIASDEFLAFHFRRADAAAGDWEVALLVEAQVVDLEANKTVCDITTDQYTFGLDEAVQIDVANPGTLDCLTVQRFDISHPDAPAGIQTGRYWTITGVNGVGDPAEGYSLTLVLPHDGLVDPRACRYPGGLGGAGWDCDDGTHTITSTTHVTRTQITALSDWAIGNNVGPTPVRARGLGVGTQGLAPLLALLLALGGAAALRRKRR